MRNKSFNKEMQALFGGKVWRLSLSSAMTCPNRDGHISTGGCIFCSEGGSGEFASPASLPIEEQLKQAKAMVAAKRSHNFAGYMAYFQSFSSTYAPLQKLRELFFGAAGDPEVLALSIATRPDCLPQEVLDLLTELNHIKPVWVELGLQTASDETARIINRGYDRSVFEKAVTALNARSIRVVVHTIIGLPGENKETILDTYRYLRDFSLQHPIDAVKLQQLCILRGTRLAEGLTRDSDGRLFWHTGDRFRCVIDALGTGSGASLTQWNLSPIAHCFTGTCPQCITQNNGQELLPLPEYTLESYVSLLKEILAILPEEICIHRLVANPPRNLLISPTWCNDKKKAIDYIQAALLQN